jgi:hypothetical protein
MMALLIVALGVDKWTMWLVKSKSSGAIRVVSPDPARAWKSLFTTHLDID